MKFKHATWIILGLVAVILLFAVLIAAWPYLVRLGPVFAFIIEFFFGGAAALALTWGAVEIHGRNLHHRRFAPTSEGNYPALLARGRTFIKPDSGNYLQPVPQTLHQHNDIEAFTRMLGRTTVQEDQAPALGPGTPSQPTLDDVLNQMEENSLMVSPGIRQSNGEVVKVSIVDVPHLKIIGSTGFGKSCLAGAILDQATQLNSPDVLQLALLDLEHKTSRLFEHLPHLAELQVGKRRVSMVATNADEVAEHLGYLKMELARRAPLSEEELEREPVLLMYVEEMLSLQFEVDEKLLDRMFADLTILSVRGRKYGMFLLACMQTDYSTKEMRVSQKMFRFRAAAAIDTKAANAAGFINTTLIKENFSQGKPGQFVVEYPSFSDVVLAPRYDVKRLIAQKTRMNGSFSTRSAPFRDRSEEVPPLPFRVVNGSRTGTEPLVNDGANGDERAWQAKLEQVRSLRSLNWGKERTINKVWGAKKGSSQAYRQAEDEYEQMLSQLEREA